MIVLPNFHQKVIEISQNPNMSNHDLPEELLVHIFSYLNAQEQLKIDRVCKDWHMIHIKDEENLDKYWELKWFNEYPEPYVKNNITWKKVWSNANQWICENPIAYYLNKTDLSNLIVQNHIQKWFDDEISIKKLKISVASGAILGFTGTAIGYSLVLFAIGIPVMAAKLSSSVYKSVSGRKLSLIDNNLESVCNAFMGMVIIASSLTCLCLFVSTHIAATKGIRMKCQMKASKYLEKNSGCNIL